GDLISALEGAQHFDQMSELSECECAAQNRRKPPDEVVSLGSRHSEHQCGAGEIRRFQLATSRRGGVATEDAGTCGGAGVHRNSYRRLETSAVDTSPGTEQTAGGRELCGERGPADIACADEEDPGTVRSSEEGAHEP